MSHPAKPAFDLYFGFLIRFQRLFLCLLRGLNKVTLIGNLGKDPDGQVLDGHVAIAKFLLATSETWRDKSGQPQTSPNWHRAVARPGRAGPGLPAQGPPD